MKIKNSNSQVVALLLLATATLCLSACTSSVSYESTKSQKSSIESSDDVKESSLQRINRVVKANDSQTEVTIFHEDSLANDENAPYNVVINFSKDSHLASCNAAKNSSYEITKALYSDSVVRKDLQRVMVNIPNYLRTSLGATDGVALAEKNGLVDLQTTGR